MASPMNNGGAADHAANRENFGVLEQSVDLGDADADENRRGDDGERVSLADRPKNAELDNRGEQPAGQ